jgi:hypothetical protein
MDLSNFLTLSRDICCPDNNANNGCRMQYDWIYECDLSKSDHQICRFNDRKVQFSSSKDIAKAQNWAVGFLIEWLGGERNSGTAMGVTPGGWKLHKSADNHVWVSEMQPASCPSISSSCMITSQCQLHMSSYFLSNKSDT